QGKFYDMEQQIWENGFGKDLSAANMAKLADSIGLDMTKYKVDIASDACKKDLADDMKILSAVGVSATPSFFVNGRFIEGAKSADQFKAIIDEELKKADAAIQGGVKAEEYYGSLVAKGKKSTQ